MTTKQIASVNKELLQKRIDELMPLLSIILKAKDPSEKFSILEKAISQIRVDENLGDLIKKCNQHEKFIIYSLFAIGEGPHLFRDWEKQSETVLKHFLELLSQVETHYDTIGGLIGYHVTVLKLIIGKNLESLEGTSKHYLHPVGIDLTKDTPELRQAVRVGIEKLPVLAEMYPIGGAGDRLNLHDEKTSEALPAAELLFCGRTLLEDLIRDLQAREYLHYKLLSKQTETPIAMMTSHEKSNHHHILKICTAHNWFGRDKKSFFLFTQPLVPVITIQGEWAKLGSLQLLMKPGGHGVIWKLAKNTGVVDTFLEKGHRFALMRQINNPVAGMDHGLLAFVGCGIRNEKTFGFASCPRALNATEGMVVLIENEVNEEVDYSITNIEYTEFEKHGISDIPASPGSSYSTFPANTNILFVDLHALDTLVEQCPIPGMLVNTKNKAKVYDRSDELAELPVGRLESTMQNIADKIVDHYPKKLNPLLPKYFSSYLTYNERRKTISVTKKSYHTGEPAAETPESCLYDLLKNHYELLTAYCKVDIPVLNSFEKYLREGPTFYMLFHPALGPLYPIIAQKIKGGKITKGSELQLEIAELEMMDLQLSGSLLITAKDLLGKRDKQGIIRYGEETGKCILKHVVVKNAGMQEAQAYPFWRNQIQRKEALEIVLEGNAEFFAEDVTFIGNVRLEVPTGHRMTAVKGKIGPEYRLDVIKKPTWYWQYSFDAEDRIQLSNDDTTFKTKS